MNLKSMVILEVENNGNAYQFHMPVGAKYGEAYDAAFAVLEEILKISKDALNTAKRPEEEVPVQEAELV